MFKCYYKKCLNVINKFETKNLVLLNIKVKNNIKKKYKDLKYKINN
jgi:hypothetical protein